MFITLHQNTHLKAGRTFIMINRHARFLGKKKNIYNMEVIQ